MQCVAMALRGENPGRCGVARRGEVVPGGGGQEAAGRRAGRHAMPV